MKTLFSRVLLAQVIAVAVALVVVAAITRVSLNRGFRDFLNTQETVVLETMAPVLANVFEDQGGWQFLRTNPQSWQRIWRNSVLQQDAGPLRPPRQRQGRSRDHRPPPLPPAAANDPQAMRRMRTAGLGQLRERLFLLDDALLRVAGARVDAAESLELRPIEVEGNVVGWVGFAPIGKVLPPEAERFFRGQVRITAISLVIGLFASAGLAFLLARNLSRPVRELEETVKHLSRGHYDTRASVSSPEEIGRLAAHVNQLASTLEKNRTARQRWMADIAHELRTPVAVLKGEIEAVSDGVRTADELTTKSLQEEVEQLSRLIDDLQTLALSDAGALNIHKEKISLDSIIQQCAAPYQKRLQDRNIALDIRAGGYEILADPRRLRQLLQNLMENVCRYVVQGGTVLIQVTPQPGGCELVIEDSGPGLNEEQISQLFERFYRVDASRSRASGGTGLGLSICKNIVEAHGGTIQAERSSLGGLKIRIELPH